MNRTPEGYVYADSKCGVEMPRVTIYLIQTSHLPPKRQFKMFPGHHEI